MELLAGSRLQVLAPIVRGRRELKEMLRKGFVRVRIDDEGWRSPRTSSSRGICDQDHRSFRETANVPFCSLVVTGVWVYRPKHAREPDMVQRGMRIDMLHAFPVAVLARGPPVFSCVSHALRPTPWTLHVTRLSSVAVAVHSGGYPSVVEHFR